MRPAQSPHRGPARALVPPGAQTAVGRKKTTRSCDCSTSLSIRRRSGSNRPRAGSHALPVRSSCSSVSRPSSEGACLRGGTRGATQLDLLCEEVDPALRRDGIGLFLLGSAIVVGAAMWWGLPALSGMPSSSVSQARSAPLATSHPFSWRSWLGGHCAIQTRTGPLGRQMIGWGAVALGLLGLINIARWAAAYERARATQERGRHHWLRLIQPALRPADGLRRGAVADLVAALRGARCRPAFRCTRFPTECAQHGPSCSAADGDRGEVVRERSIAATRHTTLR